MNLISINIHDPNNLGDQVCNPCDYFPELKNVPRVDAWDWPQWVEDTEHDIIFGGGGMVHGVLVEALRRIKRVPNRKLIAWGLGHNQHGETTNDYAGCLDGFDLIGVRDFGRSIIEGWEFVPCPSCLHEAWNMRWDNRWMKDYGDGSSIMVYSHHDVPVVLKRPERYVTCLTNDFKYQTKDDALHFLARLLTGHSRVITNSYHGAYWCALIGVPFVIYKPFSSRFLDTPYVSPTCDENTWKEVTPMSCSRAIGEYRDLNRNFYEKVKQVLGIHDAGNDRGAGGHRDPVPAASVGADRRHAEGAD